MILRNHLVHHQLRILIILLIALPALLQAAYVHDVYAYQYPRSCNDCHNMPPLDSPFRNITTGGFKGNHQSHALPLQETCRRCHPGSETYNSDHTDTIIPFADNINNSPAGSRYLIYGAAVSFYNHTSLPLMGSCSNVNCHFETTTPLWGSVYYTAPGDCAGCHGAPPAGIAPDYSGGAAGKHAIHEINFPGVNNCNKCHPDHLAAGNPFSHATSAGHSGSSISIALNPGTYSGSGTDYLPSQAGGKTFGTCSGTYCHGSGTPDWNNGSLPTDCTGCHGNDAASAAPMQTGRHYSHMNNYTTLGRGNNFPCAECHAGTVSDNRTRRSNGLHLNGVKNYSGARAGRISTAGSGVCSTVYCHSTGMQINQHHDMGSSGWYAGRSFSCSGCHGAPALPDGTFAAFTSVAGEPAYANGGTGTPTANSHNRHVAQLGISDSTGCGRCHRNTADTSIAGKLRDYSSLHLNRVRNVAFSEALQGRYSSTTQQCVSLYCHSNGLPFDNSTTQYTTPAWGDSPLTCASCHSDGGDAGRLSGRHAKHTGGFYRFSCSRCHYSTMNNDGTIKDKKRHADRSKDIAFREGGTYNSVTKGCSIYCHSDARGGAPTTPVTWKDTTPLACYSCHKGVTGSNTPGNCSAVKGVWNSYSSRCTPDLTMWTNGHHRLVGDQWVRKYPCYYCHADTVDTGNAVISAEKHLNGVKDVSIASRWAIVGQGEPVYNPATKVCDNVYCHSDGTTDPKDMRPFAWTEPKTECNSCHGHPTGSCSNAGCHDGRLDVFTGKTWTVMTGWPSGSEWMGAMPMFPNQGAGTPRANSHTRHSQTNFTCDSCHAATVRNGACSVCHKDGIPSGGMGEVAHIDAAFHVNKAKDVSFKDGGSYNIATKTCSGTVCHTSGTDPVWGGSVNSAITCLNCHGAAGADQDDYNAFNGTQGRISLVEWVTTGHGRYSTSGRYPVSNNPAANFPGNPCWYCHDNSVLHKTEGNPYRLKMHRQFERRFEKECVYCHMSRTDSECAACHVGQSNSLAPQATAGGVLFRFINTSTEIRFQGHAHTANCTNAGCHDSDSGLFPGGQHKGHSVDAGVWTADQKADVKSQYLMMGVCLQCHDDDSGGQCTSCHIAPTEDPYKYSLGYNPGTGARKPKNARASAGHFGYKHYRAFKNSGGWTKIPSAAKSPIWGTYSTYQGTWKGGKFCWDCHDPHGDSNIYMIQKKVATTTDGRFGIPLSRADVTFTRKQSGLDYARNTAPYDGICNVCHSASSKHFTSVSGDGHNVSRVCTTCHEHRFADSHANRQSCSTAGCHLNSKPVPKHTAFGLPRDCTKCHAGTIGKRMDVMTQFKSNSHHVQRVTGEIKNTDCYQCHWEARSNGLIDIDYHEGYNYKNYSTVKNRKVDLVLYGAGFRPTVYKNSSSAVQFLASNIGTASERAEAAKVGTHCLSCHSDNNNTTDPFGDCKTPRQYAWDRSSVASRYSQSGTTIWGKYAGTANAAKKNMTKAFSAHGNAAANQGGWSTVNGTDATISNTRGGAQAVQCFDCHSSHGSKVVGTTSSYVTFNGTKNGGNLKETQAGKGGYAMTYKASSNSDSGSINPYNAGAGQCFDCHLTRNSGTTPWGYFSTFGAISSVRGFRDTDRFGAGSMAGQARRSPFKNIATKGGHFKKSSNLVNTPMGTIDGLCTPCHDPHGISKSLESDQAYAVPLLKGTWMTSPYKEDLPRDGATTGTLGSRTNQNPTPIPYVYTDQKTFGTNVWISESDSKFAGLCIACHPKSSLTAGANKSKSWKGIDRIHQTVKGWGVNDMHAFTCSKCHVPHVSNLPRLMQTNCLEVKHRGRVASGGASGQGSGTYPKGKGMNNQNCHPTGAWPDNSWNTKTPW